MSCIEMRLEMSSSVSSSHLRYDVGNDTGTYMVMILYSLDKGEESKFTESKSC